MGQEYTYKADVASINETAYYKIVLSPELLGKLKTDQSDLRIFDNNGKEQPYLRHQELEVSSTSLFKEYEIIEKEYKEDAISHLIFHNPEKREIDNVSFIVKNTDVQKRARLSGSDDQENWYVIKDNYLLHAMHSKNATSELKILNFPLSDYTYFRLEINDNWRLPINILKVGYYDTHLIKGISTEFDYPIAHQKDSLKTSFVKLELSEKKYLEKLSIKVSGADYYSRYTNVLVKKERLNSKKKEEVFFQSIGTFELNSNSRNEVDLGGLSVKDLYLEIDNKDNQPLIVEKVTASYLNQYAVVELEPQTNYTLKFGDKNLRSPEYDLVAFENKIIPGTTKISHSEVISLMPLKETKVKAPSIFENDYFIWFVIGAVGIVLGLISVKMIKEMGKKNNT
ncbi:MAG: hypothetical protein OEW67_10945 [Cyclobacteriaceae bacterium]|nr:hypothetical protein [Cyclobacteriaceae bacterium]